MSEAVTMRNSSLVLHETYLPFTDAQLRVHFAPIVGEGDADPDRHLAYYRASLARLRGQAASTGDPQATKHARQVEKDERFWVVAALMALHHRPDRVGAYSALMQRSDVRPPGAHARWQEALAGDLYLYFETGLTSPRSYREHLLKHLDERSPIPYVREAAGKAGLRLEGATRVDALLIAPHTGVGVLIEAKVISDCSAIVTYDVLRNQLARNIDVMLERQGSLPFPLCAREPELSCFVLLTPELFRERPRSRLYGWLLNEYRTRPEALAEDLPHRRANWQQVSKRIGWATFEDCKRIEEAACPWLPTPAA